LLPIGLTGLWAGFFHVFFPRIAGSLIGWETSPFQFEVGMADLAIGFTACAAFWSDLSFKTAAVVAASLFLLGDAIGHVRQNDCRGQFCARLCGRTVLHGHHLSRARDRSRRDGKATEATPIIGYGRSARGGLSMS
jgi:hypothetical protein